ncbi:single-stranded DNA-binding protein [Flavihumibacter solisilvae]|uniref:Single-stranded DNA-binding protein n=1 Tax=Flavihumibacter solisilvae TaxID=1349421 RepID=A0A0C1LMK1_9BACT|nr:single-stranded DNA-binding protein [Flavihumibacter solisilvae]KIC96523.1 single-stranded DNA-binding protein [Flavihumibacter solisilvae]
MSASKNKVQLVGYLGADPEIRVTTTGKKVARFNVATNETYQNSQGEKVTETQWHHLVGWGHLADQAEQDLRKGIEVSVEGKIVYRSYLDKDGVKKYVTEVNVFEFTVLEAGAKHEV